MADDPRIVWKLANPYGVLRDEAQDTWWSGRVFDVKELDGGEGGLLLGTESGGVWFVDSANHALPLSDTWTDPDVNCLAAGPDGPRHFFAGCMGGTIYETDASLGAPLLHWSPVSAPLPAGAGAVHSIAIIHRHRFILAACAGGLYWSGIPKSPEWWCVLARLPPRSGRRPAFEWKRATEQDVGPLGYFDLAVTSVNPQTEPAGEEELSGIRIVAGARRGGILVGSWTNGQLSLKRPKLMFGDDDLAALMFGGAGGPTSVASCLYHPRRAYAVCAKGDGRVHLIARTDDGGLTWTVAKYKVDVAGEEKDARVLAGEQGAGAAPNNCIAVHPGKPDTLGFGWQAGTFVSQDGADSWVLVDAQVHHADVHVLMFAPAGADYKDHLYIGSDGGLAQVALRDVFAVPPIKYVARSDYNRNLATLQFYSTLAARHFYGTTSIAPDGSGWIAAGVHDNGNIFCNSHGDPTPWRQLMGGDGGFNGLVLDGGVVANEMGQPAVYGLKSGGSFVNKGVVPVKTSLAYPGGLVSPFADVVRIPKFRSHAGELLLAVSANPKVPGDVHGLFQGSNQTYHWVLLGRLPGAVVATAVASYDGHTCIVAAGNRIFALDSKNGSAFEFAVDLPKPASNVSQTGGQIARIAMLGQDVGFAMLNLSDKTNCYILRLDGLRWVLPLSSGLPTNSLFHGLDGIRFRNRSAVFAATDDRVYLSEDSGEHWVQASQGLPRIPHCADLRTGRINDDAFVFLGTYGRSLWRAELAELGMG